MSSKRKPKPYRFVNLPKDFHPVDATVDEVASFRREGRWTVFNKIRNGAYESYRDGRIRKIVFASVLADRERTIAASRKQPEPEPVARAGSDSVEKRPKGRPRKSEAATASAG
jgi:hypothetical protein